MPVAVGKSSIVTKAGVIYKDIDVDVLLVQPTLECSRRFDMREVAYDRWQATQLATRLQDQGADVIEFRQTVANFSEPTKELDALMRSGRIAHDGDPVLAWMLGNVVGHYDAKENVYPRKERPENKIDGAIALIMALGRHMVVKNEPTLDDFINNIVMVI